MVIALVGFMLVFLGFMLGALYGILSVLMHLDRFVHSLSTETFSTLAEVVEDEKRTRAWKQIIDD
jgi:hypothetical protein